MRDSRTRWGLFVTVLWVVAMFVLMYDKNADLPALPINAWGDFFAGAFAPLAFLWLVLGYMQQGEELKLSTEALKLQAEELRNSVEQQRHLVEVSRLQVEQEREALAAERQGRIDAARPNISVEAGGGAFAGNGLSSYNIILLNMGSVACKFEATARHPLGKLQALHKVPMFDRGQRQRVTIDVDQPQKIEGLMLEICYLDSLGTQFIDKYLVNRQSDHPHSDLTLTRVSL